MTVARRFLTSLPRSRAAGQNKWRYAVGGRIPFAAPHCAPVGSVDQTDELGWTLRCSSRDQRPRCRGARARGGWAGRKLGELAGLSSVDWTRLHPNAVSVVSRGARVPDGDTIRRCSPRVDQCFSNALPALSLWPATRLASQRRAGPVTRPGGRIAGGCPSPRRHTSRRLRFP
jgi:hypothetical protein